MTTGLAWVFIAAALTGCAWFGELTPRARMHSLPQVETTLESARASAGLDTPWPTLDWWTRFDTPQLNQLVETALADNPDFKAAVARLNQAQALVDAQAAEQYPTIDANVSFSAQRFSANSTQAKLAGEHFRQLLANPLVLRYHLDFWGRDQAALQAAVGRSFGVSAEIADAKLLLTATMAGAYFDARTAKAQLDIADTIADRRQTLLNQERIRLDNGLSSNGPLLQAKLALNLAHQSQASARAELGLRKNLLAALAGRGPDWSRDITVEAGVCNQPPPLPRDIPLHLLARRPDIAAARQYVEAAAEDIKVAETAFYPDINLIAFTGLHSVSLSDVLLQGSSLAYAVGPSIELPIFEGGRLRANLSFQQAAYDAAVERYNASLTHAVREVADALSRWREIDTAIAEQRQSVAEASEAERLTESLNRAGLADLGTLIQSQLASQQQRLRLAELEGDHCKAAVQIIKALGGGFSDNPSPTHPR